MTTWLVASPPGPESHPSTTTDEQFQILRTNIPVALQAPEKSVQYAHYASIELALYTVDPHGRPHPIQL